MLTLTLSAEQHPSNWFVYLLGKTTKHSSFLSHQHPTMSSTTTTQTRTRQNVLKDYELHHSATSSLSTTPAEAASRSHTGTQNPPGWDTTHRRVPQYRPVNAERDQSEVRVYTSTIERVFLGTMFTGVFTTAVSLTLLETK